MLNNVFNDRLLFCLFPLLTSWSNVKMMQRSNASPRVSRDQVEATVQYINKASSLDEAYSHAEARGVSIMLTHFGTVILKSPICCFLKCQIRVLWCSKFQILWWFLGDMHKNIYDKAIVKFWFHPRVYNIAYNALDTVYSLHWKDTATLQTGLIQIFSKCTVLFYWFLLCVYHVYVFFYCIFVFQYFRHQKSCFLWNSEFFCFLPKFHTSFCFPYHGNWGVYVIRCRSQYVTSGNLARF